MDTPNEDECEIPSVFVVYVILKPIVSIFGIVLNIINLVVFTHNGYRLGSSMLRCFVALAGVDLITLSLFLPIGLIRCFPSENKNLQYGNNFFQVYLYLPLANVFTTCNTWLTVLVTFERFISLYCTRLIHLKKYTKIYICGSIVTSLVFHLPYYFVSTITGDGIEYTTFGESNAFSDYDIVKAFITLIIPVCIVIILNGLLLQFTWKRSKQLRTTVFPAEALVKRRRRQIRLTVMLLSITFVFVLCNIPESLGHSVFRKCVRSSCIEIGAFANLFQMVSFSTNFFSFCIFNQAFRDVLTARCSCKPVPQTSIMLTSSKEQRFERIREYSKTFFHPKPGDMFTLQHRNEFSTNGSSDIHNISMVTPF